MAEKAWREAGLSAEKFKEYGLLQSFPGMPVKNWNILAHTLGGARRKSSAGLSARPQPDQSDKSAIPGGGASATANPTAGA